MGNVFWMVSKNPPVLVPDPRRQIGDSVHKALVFCRILDQVMTLDCCGDNNGVVDLKGGSSVDLPTTIAEEPGQILCNGFVGSNWGSLRDWVWIGGHLGRAWRLEQWSVTIVKGSRQI